MVPAAVGFAFAWALVGLTYLMPPFQVYGLLTFSLYRYEVIFLGAATTVLSLNSSSPATFFCRYACAIGLFQSFAWMGNRNAMVVGFQRDRLADCANCLEGAAAATPRLPDAPEAAQRQALDVRLHPVRAVRLGLRHGQSTITRKAPCCTG